MRTQHKPASEYDTHSHCDAELTWEKKLQNWATVIFFSPLPFMMLLSLRKERRKTLVSCLPARAFVWRSLPAGDGGARGWWAAGWGRSAGRGAGPSRPPPPCSSAPHRAPPQRLPASAPYVTGGAWPRPARYQPAAPPRRRRRPSPEQRAEGERQRPQPSLVRRRAPPGKGGSGDPRQPRRGEGGRGGIAPARLRRPPGLSHWPTTGGRPRSPRGRRHLAPSPPRPSGHGRDGSSSSLQRGWDVL